MKKRDLKKITRAAFGLTTLTALLFVLPQTSQSSPPISITGCTTISSSGQYRLDTDLTFTPGPAGLPTSSTCITIGASNVDLNLNGHTITGPGGGSDGTAGISVTAKTMVDIKGPGIITSFGRGIDFDGVTSSDVKQVTATGNFFGFVVNNNSQGNLFRENTSTGNAQHGFTLNGAINNGFLNNVASNNGAEGILLFAGSGNQVKGNTTNGNGQDGILSGGGVSTGHSIKDNTATGNGLFGIRLLAGSTGNNVKGNTAQSNNSTDLVDNNANCDNNTWADNIFNTASQSCIQ
jgi:parallel beta-helix repeat protein